MLNFCKFRLISWKLHRICMNFIAKLRTCHEILRKFIQKYIELRGILFGNFITTNKFRSNLHLVLFKFNRSRSGNFRFVKFIENLYLFLGITQKKLRHIWIENCIRK